MGSRSDRDQPEGRERTETLLTTPVHGTIAVPEMGSESEEGMVYQRRCVGQVCHLKTTLGRHDTRNERVIPSVFGLPANDVTDHGRRSKTRPLK